MKRGNCNGDSKTPNSGYVAPYYWRSSWFWLVACWSIPAIAAVASGAFSVFWVQAYCLAVSACRVPDGVRSQAMGVWGLLQEVKCCGFGMLKADGESVPCHEGNVTEHPEQAGDHAPCGICQPGTAHGDRGSRRSCQ